MVKSPAPLDFAGMPDLKNLTISNTGILTNRILINWGVTNMSRYPSQIVSDLKATVFSDFVLGDFGNPPRQYIVITGESKGDMSLHFYFLIEDFLSKSW